MEQLQAVGMRERVLDVRGQRCPMPLVSARKELVSLGDGEVLRVVTTDRGSVLDFQGFVRQNPGFLLLDQSEEKDEAGKTTFVHRLVRKA